MTATTTATTSTSTTTQDQAHARRLAEALIGFLETGEAPAGLLAPDVLCDLTMPTWRLQASGSTATVGLRHAGHPSAGTVTRWRFDPIPTGFVLEVEEAWDADGEQWTCRELFRADVSEQGITELSVYCTGDWDAARRAEHAAAEVLIRP